MRKSIKIAMVACVVSTLSSVALAVGPGDQNNRGATQRGFSNPMMNPGMPMDRMAKPSTAPGKPELPPAMQGGNQTRNVLGTPANEMGKSKWPR